MLTTTTNQSICVVGCGYWGKNLVRNFAQLQVLHSVCDSDELTLRAMASQYPGVHSTRDFGDVLMNEAIRAVVIATPAAQHYAQVKQSIQQGKHVFVEKPLALRYEQGRELVELAEVHGSTLMVGHILEYHPAIQLLKEIIRQGELGQVRYIYSNRLNLGKVRKEENILWSFAPHDISVICTLLDDSPVMVSASGGSYLQPDIVDVTVTNLLFENGGRGHIFVSWLHPFKEQKLVVIGDRKMAVFDDMAREGKLKIYDKGIDWRSGLPIPRQTAETILFFEDMEPLRLECEHFLECVRGARSPLTDGRSALRVLGVLEASQASLQQGGMPIRVSDVTVANIP